MRNRCSTLAALAAGCFFVVGCSNDNGDSDAATSAPDAASAKDGGGVDQSAPADEVGAPGQDAGAACCPVGYMLYDCELPGGGTGMACHDPAMGCASSTTCGQGCDPQVVGRCACVENQLCQLSEHFDINRCACVPNQDADAGPDAPADAKASDAKAVDTSARVDGACVDNLLCIRGDHFDPTLCRCVPDSDGAVDGPAQVDGACVDNLLCIRGDHFDPALCRCVPDTDAGVTVDVATHGDGPCLDTVLCIAGDHFDSTLCRCVPDGNACTSASECVGALPALCETCADATAGCAHFACTGGKCTIAYCP